MDQVQINSDQQINLTGEDEKQMIKDLDDLRKMQQKLMKKMMEFRQKYGTMPVLEWVEDWRVAWNPAVRAFKGAEFACAAS